MMRDVACMHGAITPHPSSHPAIMGWASCAVCGARLADVAVLETQMKELTRERDFYNRKEAELEAQVAALRGERDHFKVQEVKDENEGLRLQVEELTRERDYAHEQLIELGTGQQQTEAQAAALRAKAAQVASELTFAWASVHVSVNHRGSYHDCGEGFCPQRRAYVDALATDTAACTCEDRGTYRVPNLKCPVHTVQVTTDTAEEENCPCEYPHYNDYDFAVFEMCTCKPDCYHVSPLIAAEEGKDAS